MIIHMLCIFLCNLFNHINNFKYNNVFIQYFVSIIHILCIFCSCYFNNMLYIIFSIINSLSVKKVTVIIISNFKYNNVFIQYFVSIIHILCIFCSCYFNNMLYIIFSIINSLSVKKVTVIIIRKQLDFNFKW